MSLVYAKEKPLFVLVAAASAIAWLVLVGATLGFALVYAPFAFLGYCFMQSGFIAYVRGTGVELGADQMPDLHRQFRDCCERLGLEAQPRAFILNAGGMMNALATRFLRRHYVILFSDVLDGLEKHPAALDFYMGHEIGHIKRGHLSWGWFVAPGMLLPLLGSAYSRAREYTCDLHGLACCDEPKDAAIALGLLAAGTTSWEKLNLHRYAEQSGDATGFWMSFHELTSDYPWLTKRMKHLMSAAAGRPALFPGRSPLAYLLALGVPRIAAGPGGGIVSLMMVVAVVGILAAVAIPNFLRFQQRALIGDVRAARDSVKTKATVYIDQTGYLPAEVEQIGLPASFANTGVTGVEVTESGFVLHLSPKFDTKEGAANLSLTPYRESDGAVAWRCEGSLEPVLLDLACGDAPLAPRMAGLAGLGSAGQEESGAGSAAAQATSLAPDAQTCSAEFRQGADYAQLSAADRDALRMACNLWRLDQVP